MMDSYCIRDRETGTLIDTFTTFDEARKTLDEYENEDEKDGIYIPNFYEICVKDNGDWRIIY